MKEVPFGEQLDHYLDHIETNSAAGAEFRAAVEHEIAEYGLREYNDGLEDGIEHGAIQALHGTAAAVEHATRKMVGELVDKMVPPAATFVTDLDGNTITLLP